MTSRGLFARVRVGISTVCSIDGLDRMIVGLPDHMRQRSAVVVLTGAGISADSGLQTFRANDGLWENHRIEDVASPAGFASDPQLVHRFYNGRRKQLLSGDVRPNPAHYALAEFETEWPGDYLLVTQNIDNLHEWAGSRKLVHMHGELLKKRCVFCGDVTPVDTDLSVRSWCDRCNAKGGLRPHVVWFGETPMEMDTIDGALRGCGLFVAIGTSGSVYPAAGFVSVANSVGAYTVELNLEPSAQESAFQERNYGPAAELVPEFFARVKG